MYLVNLVEIEQGYICSPITWVSFSEIFLDRLYPRELREVKAHDLMNMRQGNMTVQEY